MSKNMIGLVCAAMIFTLASIYICVMADESDCGDLQHFIFRKE